MCLSRSEQRNCRRYRPQSLKPNLIPIPGQKRDARLGVAKNTDNCDGFGRKRRRELNVERAEWEGLKEKSECGQPSAISGG